MGKMEIWRGWVLQRADGDYVSSIISNGHPDSPVVYYTANLEDARPFSRFKAAEKRALQLGLMILRFRTDDAGKRKACGYEG